MMIIAGDRGDDDRVPALPERCPQCGAEGFNRDRETFFRGVVRTPIRAHTTGTNAIGQVLVDRMADVLGTESGAASTIVFADSRDDAANTAAGLELNHFRDLVRQLIRREARTDDPEKLLRLIRSAAAGTQAPTAEDAVVLDQFKRAYPDEWTAYRLAARAAADAAEERLIDGFEAVHRKTAGRGGLGNTSEEAGAEPGESWRQPWRALPDLVSFGTASRGGAFMSL